MVRTFSVDFINPFPSKKELTGYSKLPEIIKLTITNVTMVTTHKRKNR